MSMYSNPPRKAIHEKLRNSDEIFHHPLRDRAAAAYADRIAFPCLTSLAPQKRG
jgi:hypothetical protein